MNRWLHEVGHITRSDRTAVEAVVPLRQYHLECMPQRGEFETFEMLENGDEDAPEVSQKVSCWQGLLSDSGGRYC